MKAGEERSSEDPGLGLVPVPPAGNAVDMQKLSTDVLLTQSVNHNFFFGELPTSDSLQCS